MWAAVAAAVIVVAAIAAFVVTRGHGHRGATRSSLPTTVRGAYAGTVGDVTQPVALRAVLDRPSVDAAAHTSATVDSASLHGGAARAMRCARALNPRRDEPVVILANATYRGNDAVIAAVHRGARTIAFVLDAHDCTVLVSQSR